MKRIILFISVLVILISVGISSGRLGVNWEEFNRQIEKYTKDKIIPKRKQKQEKVRILNEESAVIEIVEKLKPSVVTVAVERKRTVFEFDPFDPFGIFEAPRKRETRKEQADIGSGFIVASDGLVVTNKHVVSKTGVKYKVITSNNKTYEVKNIYRDPVNDIAILKIDPSANSGQALKPVKMGDSSSLKVGQLVVALGTPLGQFRGSVTKGIISGLGRGITAGSAFEGYVEKLDDVIQTDAAINPGNSGGPLVNSSSQVIGINTAVASNAENIGFALPINLVKDALENFKKTGSFQRAFLGVSYKIITRDLSVMNDIPEGAYVVDIVKNSAASKAGIKKGDIITRFDNKRIKGDKDALARLIRGKRVGDKVKVKIWREGKEIELLITLGEYISE